MREKFRKLFTQWPKYRENKTISFAKAKLDITAGLNESTETWCTKHGYEKILSTYALELVKELGVLNSDNNTN